MRTRVTELEELHIKSVSFAGPTKIGSLAVLGKGYVGMVVIAKRGGREVALKIRRTDSPRPDMRAESILLRTANTAEVGPGMIDSSKNFLVMEYVKGERFSDWVLYLKGRGSAKRLKNTIRNILEDCYRLDQIGLDHGELSDISKHVIVVDGRPVIIDFESSSIWRRPSNVTSITQAIFIGSGIAKIVQKIYKNPTKPDIIQILKQYKQEKTRENFDQLLQILRV